MIDYVDVCMAQEWSHSQHKQVRVPGSLPSHMEYSMVMKALLTQMYLKYH